MDENPYRAPQAIEAEVVDSTPAVTGNAPSLEYHNSLDDLAAISIIYLRDAQGLHARGDE
jgi:hypothetical protein